MVLTIFPSVSKDSEEIILVSAKKLEWIMCIQYLIVFPSGITKNGSALDPMSALFDSNSEVNVIYPAFAKKLGLVVQTINVGA